MAPGDPRQCFAKCPFTCQFDWLFDQLCQSLDRLSDHFAKHWSPPGFEVSPDHKLLAYAEDTVGGERYTLHVKDLATGAQLLSTPITV